MTTAVLTTEVPVGAPWRAGRVLAAVTAVVGFVPAAGATGRLVAVLAALLLAGTLVALPRTELARRDLLRRSLDAGTTLLAVGLLSWLGLVAPATGTAAAAPAAGVLVVVADVLVLALAVLRLSTTGAAWSAHALLCLGSAGWLVSDALLLAAPAGAWTTGLRMAGAVAVLVVVRPRRGADPDRPPRAVLFLPYLPVTLAMACLPVLVVDPSRAGRTELLTLTAVLTMAVVRHYLALVDHVRQAVTLARSRERLRHESRHDPLTGLGNRALFGEQLELAVARHVAGRNPVAVLYLDLDDFKAVNDTLGHQAGDDLLVQVGQRLTAVLRGTDLVARLGGDEFAVLLTNDFDARVVVQRLTDALTRPYLIGGRPLTVLASLGSAMLTADDEPVDRDLLVARADTAMYAAKQATKAARGARLPELLPG